MRSAVLTAALLGAVVVLLSALGPAALAHAELADRRPGPGETVEQLGRIRLTFAGPLDEQAQRSIQLIGPQGRRWDVGPTRVESRRVLAVDVRERLPAQGEYTVRWCAVSADGHPRAGAYTFSYAGRSTTATRPGPASRQTGCFAPGSGDSAGAVIGWALVVVIAAAVVFLVGSTVRRRLRAGRASRPSP